MRILHIIHYTLQCIFVCMCYEQWQWQTNQLWNLIHTSSIEFEFKFRELNVIYYCSTMRHPHAFIRMHQSLFCLTLFLFPSLFSCITYFLDYLLIYCIHILYKNHHFIFLWFMCVLFYLYPCTYFTSNYFTINFQMHFYNAWFAWASLYCSSCQ